MNATQLTNGDYLVPQSHAGLLYEDGAFVTTLAPGRHRFGPSNWWDRLVAHFRPRLLRRIELVDLRQRSLTIKGQEILTEDKVAIRVSVLVYFRVVDAVAATHEVERYAERIYEDVQLAARRFLASRTLDAILSDRNEVSDAVRRDVGAGAESYGVEVLRADVKDLVFPGNLRGIMNQVLETEFRAQARLVEAQKSAEALRIQAETEREAERAKLEAEKDRIRIRAEAERDKRRLALEAELADAQAATDHPALLELRRLETLAAMAKGGAKFLVGLDETTIGQALEAS